MKTELKFKNLNNEIIELNTENEKIKDINFSFNSSIKNIKLSISGDLEFLVELSKKIEVNSDKCIGIFINDIEIIGVKDVENFINGNSTIVSTVSTEPIFYNNTKALKNNEYYLNIDYYTSN